MKNLLRVLGTLVIASSAVALVTPITQTVTNTSVAASQTYYWNNSHSNIELSVDAPWNQGSDSRKWFTFNLGRTNSFSNMSLIDSKGFSFSWGNTRYGFWSMYQESISLDWKSEVKITNANFDKYLQYSIYSEVVWDGLASCHSITDVGYAWYQENGNYYFQFLVYQFLQPINSFSGGANFANLGIGLLLS